MKSKLRGEDPDRMLLSSRANPPRPLRLTSNRHLSVKHLLQSPIPSPSLPSILPRHGKKPPPLNTRKALRLLFWLAIGVTIYWFVSLAWATSKGPALTTLTDLPYLTSSGKSYEIIGGDELPDYATPITMTDRRGKHRWTVSIPEKLDFPLPATDYADICAHVEEVARHTAGQKKQRVKTVRGYYNTDERYVDVETAQSTRLLPLSPKALFQPADDLPVCARSLTYVLDATDAGLGSQLLGLWLSYGLAKREDREFFIDDTHFAYGNFSTFFAPPPSSTCRQPPKSHRLPCPHQAKHLVVSTATHPWTFGEDFEKHYSQRDIFDMARAGYQALFRLRPDDASYARERIRQLRNHPENPQKTLVGIHLRRGDRHPFEFAYQHGYLPPHRYLETAQSLTSSMEDTTIFLASDDPDIYNHNEFAGIARAQDRITLASKKTLAQGGLGWEGGFFKDLFWGLGLPLDVQEQKRVGSPLPTRQREESKKTTRAGRERPRDYRSHPTKDALQLREFIGRAYLLELMVLGESDRVVCAVSSYACRILAIMLNWERSFEHNHWKNVDGRYEWRALDI